MILSLDIYGMLCDDLSFSFANANARVFHWQTVGNRTCSVERRGGGGGEMEHADGDLSPSSSMKLAIHDGICCVICRIDQQSCRQIQFDRNSSPMNSRGRYQ